MRRGSNEESLECRQITWIRNRLVRRVKHLIQVDTSQLDRWEEVVQRPVENVVEHLLEGTLPDVKVNHAFWDQQSASFELERGLKVDGIKSSSVMCAIR